MALQEIQNSFMSRRLQEPRPVLFGQFEILRGIGSGGFGVVCAGRDQRDKSLVAVKINTAPTFENCFNEDFILRSIGHLEYFPSILFTAPYFNMVHTVMSFEGPSMSTIAEYSPRGKLSKRNLLLFIYHATKAVNALHNERIVHRDIRAPNFVFGKSFRKAPVVLLDFGYAQHFHMGFQLPMENFFSVIQAPPHILRGGPYCTMAEWFSVAHTTLDLAGYSQNERHTERNLTFEERANLHDARHTGLKFELSNRDQYLVPIIEKFYTPGVDVFDLQSVLSLVMAEEGFNPDEPFVVEESEEATE